jgi:hypothetical protein
VPQQGQAPTISAPQTTAQPQPEQPPTETQPAQTPAEEQPAKTESTEKTPPKKKIVKKPAPSTQQPTEGSASATAPAPKTSKLVIQEGNAPASQGQLAAGVGLDDSSPHKQTTEQLLQSAQANLNSINRPLSPDEQGIVGQIKDYMAQSRKATADSDNVRAHNLALKAHLLSDELVKH